MLKLLRVIHSINPEVGGPPEGILQISPLLSSYGIETTVACLDEPDSEWLINKPYKVISLGKGFLNYGFQFGLVQKLTSLAKNYDLVIIHGLWQYHSLATFLALKRIKKKYFLFTHGMLDPWFKKKYPLKHIKKLIYWTIFERNVAKGAEAIFFTSIQEEYLSKNWFKNIKIDKKFINYGINRKPENPEKFKKVFLKRFPYLNNKKIILFLSRIDYKKGIDILIEAFGKISHEYPELVLVVAGPFSKDYQLRQKLNTLINIFRIKDKVIFTGMLKNEMKWGAYYSSDIFCLPSHSENFGIVVAEALSCGCLVGISDKVNIYQEIKKANAGVILKDTTEDIIKALDRMLNLSNDDKAEMKKNALTLFDDKFNLLNTVNIFVKILKEYN